MEYVWEGSGRAVSVIEGVWCFGFRFSGFSFVVSPSLCVGLCWVLLVSSVLFLLLLPLVLSFVLVPFCLAF